MRRRCGYVGGKSDGKTKAKRIALRTACVVGAAAVVAVNVAVVMFRETIDTFVPADTVDISQDKVDAKLAADRDLARAIEGEGIVLAQNRDSALPLDSSVKKVNVFGWASTQWVGGGSGSGGVAGDCMSLLDALDARGISYNHAITDMYRDFHGERPMTGNGTLNSADWQYCQLIEPRIDDEDCYTPTMLADAKGYSDTAIVVLGRTAGESIDCPKEQYKIDERGGDMHVDKTRSYLELSSDEEALLRYVGANYDKVVVVVNSTNAMNLGALESIDGIDSVLLAGATGTNGAQAICDVLWGDTDPSGRTSDTYAYDPSTAASWANSGVWGEGHYTNGSGLYPADGTTNVNLEIPQRYEDVSFVDYVEGIYVGYRWYETADAEGFWNDVSNEHGKGYDGVVQYPFGYGLSYTTFDWEVVDQDPRPGRELGQDDTIATTVRVTNTGTRSGKDVVEQYVTAPYTKGGIEKASCVLVAYAKTKELAPGESQDVKLAFPARSMASYDCYDLNHNGFAGWELERGSYQVTLRHDSHTVADCRHASTTYEVPYTISYDTDPVTGATVTNKFTGTSAEAGISLDGSNSASISIDGSNTADGTPDIRYLTRADFAGTFPKERDRDREMTSNVATFNLYDEDQAEAADRAAERAGAASPSSAQTGTTSDAGGTLDIYHNGTMTQLGQQLGQNYDDPAWNTLLEHISTDDMRRIVLHGYSNTASINALGKPQNKDLDGSSQAGSFHQLSYGVGFPNPTTLAQTWNPNLALRYGRAVGMECAMLGIDGWYAPATNLHRSQLGGRNYEYYSEDPLLSGDMAAQTIAGSKDSGTYTYLKHLALNEQDSYRDSLYTWLSEQALRELYLEPFRAAVEKGGSTGIMTSYNRIGAIWAGGSSALISGVLRGEWGFKGTVITDYCDHQQYMSADQALRAGGDLYMDGVFRNGSLSYDDGSAAMDGYLRRATKDVLYTWLNARWHNLEHNQAVAQRSQAGASKAGDEILARPVKRAGVSPVLVGVTIFDAAVSLGTIVGMRRRTLRRHKKREENRA